MIRPKKKHPYDDHLDFEALTPSRLSKPLMVTAHLFIPIVTLALWRGFYVLACFLSPVYFTSLWHWHDPKKSSWARTVDIIAVLSAFCYSIYTSFQLRREITILWCCSSAVQACVFYINGVLFSYQVEKPNALVQAAYKQEDEDIVDWYKNTFSPGLHKSFIQPTWPMTRERELAYCRCIYVHMVFIHMIPCTLAIYCLWVA